MPDTHSRDVMINVQPGGYVLNSGYVRLVYEADGFDIVVSNGSGSALKSLTHDMARALRDALIEIYPLPARVEAPKVTPYHVEEDAFDWHVVREVSTMRAQTMSQYVGRADTEEDAQRIADALNAQQEG